MMKRVLGVLLAVLLLIWIVGCTAAPKPVGASNTPTAGSAEPAVKSSVPAASDPTYTWNDVELLLDEITEDVPPNPALKPPSGKYVIVTLAIQQGSIDFSVFQDEYKQITSLTCGADSYEPVTLEAQGIEIREEKVYAIGTLNFYFDLPADAEIDDAQFMMEQ